MINENIHRLKNDIDTFPRQPGVYIMKDESDTPIYIGKAVDLRTRIRSYLFERDDRRQIPALLDRLHHIEWIITANESEALILEANLVRKHKPRYNIDLRDDKHYPYLKLTTNEDFPRLFVVRRIKNDGALYFGPYTDADSMHRIVSFAKKAFKIPDCKKPIKPDSFRRPCLNYFIGRCCGVCAEKITKEEYAANIALVISFLKGRIKSASTELQRRMDDAASRMEYEKAASFRDQISFLSTAFRPRSVDLRSPETDIDVFAAYTEGNGACLCVLNFREGLLVFKRHFVFRQNEWKNSCGERERLITDYYQESTGDRPQEILIDTELGLNTEIIEEWFKTVFGSTVRVAIPERGIKKEIVELAKKNARMHLAQKMPADEKNDLMLLQSVLNLPSFPEVIEAFDISNMGESFAVAGMVRFVNGKPDKSGYRRYRIKNVSGQNDFAMLMEAVERRLNRLKEETRTFPDLLLIDGGKGQLASAMKPLLKYEKSPMIISLAKEEEILFSPFCAEPVILDSRHPARKMVQRIRDEVHRYAVSYHRRIRDKQMSRSSLQNIPGVGLLRANKLLRKFGSIKGLRGASIQEISSVSGIGDDLAQKIWKSLEG